MGQSSTHRYDTTVRKAPRSETYCTVGSELEREVQPLELLELLAAHHLAAAYCGMEGSDIDLNFVSRSGTGSECHELTKPAYGFTYTNDRGEEGTFVRVGDDRDHAERIQTVAHEVRHRWQFDADHGFRFDTEKKAERDAYGFMNDYAVTIAEQARPLTDKAAEWTLEAHTRVTLLDQYRRGLDALAPSFVRESDLPVVDNQRLGPGGGYYRSTVEVGGRRWQVYRMTCK